MVPEASIHKRLPDGTLVLVRPVHARDRELLVRGFDQFSDASRYQRFFVHKRELTDADLRYLTEIDGVRHVALGALKLEADGSQSPIGIARYVRPTDDAEVAEAAVAVIDAMQGKGIGKLLLHALSDLAYAQGVRKFRCSVLVTNRAMQKVLLELDPHARLMRRDGPVEEFELELRAPSPDEDESPSRERLSRLLRLAAERRISVRPRAHGRETSRARVPGETVSRKVGDVPS